MNFSISRAALEARRVICKPGTRIELVQMNDPYSSLKPGDRGTVTFVDDTGTVFTDWDNGSTLGMVYGEDSFRIIVDGGEHAGREAQSMVSDRKCCSQNERKTRSSYDR